MGIFLVFGSSSAINSAKVGELVRSLEHGGIDLETASSPTTLKHKADQYSHILLVVDAAMPPMADMWGSFFKSAKSYVSATLVKTATPPQFKKHFAFQKEWKFDATKINEQILAWAKLEVEAKNEDPQVSVGDGHQESGHDFLSLNEPSINVAPAAAKPAKPKPPIPKAEVSMPSIVQRSEQHTAIRVDEPIEFAVDATGADVPSFELGADFDQAVESVVSDSPAESVQSVVNDEALSFEMPDDLGVGTSAVVNDQPSVVVNSELSLSVAASSSSVKDLTEEPVLDSLQEMSDSDSDSQASQVVKRYALLKEKENREKQKTIDILRSELNKAKASYNALQSEKRKLMLKVDDSESERRALEETVDELRHKVSLSDSDTSQKIKDYQMRLENSQFLAKRLEKKLEDFKLRVRLDIQKIRARERELENRLELQKRDAEALISAKDARLLTQKREIDKLHFEMEILKERLVEETENAEDRHEKLQRAVQSLKMAQGMLSGIDEEVIATSERQSSDGSGGGEAA